MNTSLIVLAAFVQKAGSPPVMERLITRVLDTAETSILSFSRSGTPSFSAAAESTSWVLISC